VRPLVLKFTGIWSSIVAFDGVHILYRDKIPVAVPMRKIYAVIDGLGRGGLFFFFA